ncbi:MAG: hypothetical protein WA843_02920 [Candidatus Saccharimonadales bacterium]
MTEVDVKSPIDPVDEMRGLIRGIHQNGYSDVDAMQRFITLYSDHAPDDDRETFFQSLDVPDIGFEFWEGVLDDVVEAYDSRGGSRVALSFPETDHVPSTEWTKELSALETIFNTPDVVHAQTHALYVRKNAQELTSGDSNGTQLNALLANPHFLSGLVRVYDFEDEYRDTEHLPSSWPDNDDGFLGSVLKAVGYKYAGTFQKDWRHENEGHIKEGLTANLKAIAGLETARVGATQYLSEQYGIRHFSRYPTELLVSQFDNGGKVHRPYGISISAVDDHNGAFSDHWMPTNSIPSAIYFQAKETHDFLVAEAETSTEFEQRLRHFDALNGEKFKIDFALIETHGSPNSITFGTAPDLGSLALRSRLSDVRKVFSPRASIAMTGCSTGQINGIAQSLSRQFNTTVVAPSAVTATKHITFMHSQEAIRLVPTYNEKRDTPIATPIVHRKGSQLGSQKTADYLNVPSTI